MKHACRVSKVQDPTTAQSCPKQGQVKEEESICITFRFSKWKLQCSEPHCKAAANKTSENKENVGKLEESKLRAEEFKLQDWLSDFLCSKSKAPAR